MSKSKLFLMPEIIVEGSMSDATMSPISIRDSNQLRIINEYIKTEFNIYTKDIYVTNPKLMDSEMINLGLLFEQIYKSLVDSNLYMFDSDFIIPADFTLLVNQDRVKHVNIIPNKDSFNFISSTIFQSESTPIIMKQYCLNNYSPNSYTQGFICVLHEICMQYFAYILNNNRELFTNEMPHEDKLIVIPKLYCITLDKITNSAGFDEYDTINIYMQKLTKIKIIPANITSEFYEKWNELLFDIFTYFTTHNLAHLDTSNKNIYFINIDDTDKIAIIDFGESLFIDEQLKLHREGQRTGYRTSGRDIAFFNQWINGISDSESAFYRYFGGIKIKGDKRINNKRTNNKRTKNKRINNKRTKNKRTKNRKYIHTKV